MRKNELKKIKREEAAARQAKWDALSTKEKLLQEALVAKRELEIAWEKSKRELEIAWEKYQDILEKMYDNSPYQLEGHVYYVEKNEPGSLMRAPPYCLYKVKDKPDE